jgi:NADH dehydrogenase
MGYRFLSFGNAARGILRAALDAQRATLRGMLLLTGASGLVGGALRRRLIAAEVPLRCLMRDPRRLGEDRVRVQIALGDLADPPSFRNALRGVDTVVHLAATIRDQPQGSIEELSGIATWRLVDAARRAGVERFVFFSALGASTQSRARLLRAKALAEEAVRDSEVPSIIFAPSIIYAPDDRYMTLLARMSLVPAVMPFSGRGRAQYQPIWVSDVADCVMSALRVERTGSVRYELAGPEVLTHEQIVRLALRAVGRRRALARIPTPIVAQVLRAVERLMGPSAFATWDEAELMEVSMLAAAGDRDVRALGVEPRTMESVLGVS